jgi:hypothetical protein
MMKTSWSTDGSNSFASFPRVVPRQHAIHFSLWETISYLFRCIIALLIMVYYPFVQGSIQSTPSEPGSPHSFASPVQRSVSPRLPIQALLPGTPPTPPTYQSHPRLYRSISAPNFSKFQKPPFHIAHDSEHASEQIGTPPSGANTPLQRNSSSISSVSSSVSRRENRASATGPQKHTNNLQQPELLNIPDDGTSAGGTTYSQSTLSTSAINHSEGDDSLSPHAVCFRKKDTHRLADQPSQ